MLFAFLIYQQKYVHLENYFYNSLKPIFHWILGSHWPPNANEINTKKNEMYMANANILRLEPNATYIPLTRVGVLRWVTHIFSVFSNNMMV